VLECWGISPHPSLHLLQHSITQSLYLPRPSPRALDRDFEQRWAGECAERAVELPGQSARFDEPASPYSSQERAPSPA